MNTICTRGLTIGTAFTLLAIAPAIGQTPPDLTSGFASSIEDWRTSDAGAVPVWEASGGNPDGHLRATGPGGDWYLVSPSAWVGDWSDYQTLKFDLAIPSVHYPDSDSAGMVVIAGVNGMTMAWTGPTPLWTWTYYEVSLTPDAFNVDQATFDGIMANVSELRILAEFTGGTETVGLDNVVVTATPPTSFTADLRSTFTSGETEGWRVVDDANLHVVDEGRPSLALFGNDYEAGQRFKVQSPEAWAGDWRNFTEIRFDMLWTNTHAITPTGPMLTLFGANGDVLEWHAAPVQGSWQHRVIPLNAGTFSVDADRFDELMAHVSKIWIHGEYGEGGDEAWFDNITIATGPHAPVVHDTSLLSRFGTDGEGWCAYDNALFAWDGSEGFLGGGAAKVTDQGSGTARFQSPDAWAGDWRAFAALRFMIHQKTASNYNVQIWIADYNGNIMDQVFTPPLRVWTPYTVDLTAEAFGVSASLFDTIMSDAACLWVKADLDTGNDTAWLDEVSLLTAADFGGTPPERASTFDADAEGWTRGNTGTSWAIPGDIHYYYDAASDPPSCIVNYNEGTGTTVFYTPAAWGGDWRGYQSVAFDMKVVQGPESKIVDPGAMIWMVSAHGDLVADCTEAPSTTEWKRYKFALNPVAFGVSPEQYERIARDVVWLVIRSEWLTGVNQREALDNVLVSTSPTPYWDWLAGYLDEEALLDLDMAATTADADHDGRSNWDEFMALTVPIDPASRFDIDGPSAVPGGLSIKYPTHAGRVYQVWKALDLDGAWSPVGPLETGDDTLKTYVDPATEPKVFLKVSADIP